MTASAGLGSIGRSGGSGGSRRLAEVCDLRFRKLPLVRIFSNLKQNNVQDPYLRPYSLRRGRWQLPKMFLESQLNSTYGMHRRKRRLLLVQLSGRH